MPWIFQGNPNRYDIDEYLCRYSFIYWMVNRYSDRFQIRDSVFIWRSGKESGIVAYGKIAELPTKKSSVKHPEALGEDLWKSENEQGGMDEQKIGIQLNDVRLTLDEGMLPRNVFLADERLSATSIIKMPNGTVFFLNDDEFKRAYSYWSYDGDHPVEPDLAFDEGARKLRAHFARERSRKLVEWKKKDFFDRFGKLVCEVCGHSFSEVYPKELGDYFIEVHHIKPLSDVIHSVRTMLNDLILLCANCHRMVHRTAEVESNLALLLHHFGKTPSRK